jgi:hypothetical protein
MLDMGAKVSGFSRGEDSKEGGGGQVFQGSVGADGVVGFLPAAQFLVELLDAFRLFLKEMIKLVVIGFVGAFDESVLLGRAGVGEAVGVVRAGLVKGAEELAAVVG